MSFQQQGANMLPQSNINKIKSYEHSIDNNLKLESVQQTTFSKNTQDSIVELSYEYNSRQSVSPINIQQQIQSERSSMKPRQSNQNSTPTNILAENQNAESDSQDDQMSKFFTSVTKADSNLLNSSHQKFSKSQLLVNEINRKLIDSQEDDQRSNNFNDDVSNTIPDQPQSEDQLSYLQKEQQRDTEYAAHNLGLSNPQGSYNLAKSQNVKPQSKSVELKNKSKKLGIQSIKSLQVSRDLKKSQNEINNQKYGHVLRDSGQEYLYATQKSLFLDKNAKRSHTILGGTPSNLAKSMAFIAKIENKLSNLQLSIIKNRDNIVRNGFADVEESDVYKTFAGP